MRELDKTKVYSLEDLTSEEYRVLFNWLLGNDSGWGIVHFESWKNDNIGFNLKHNGSSWSMQEVKPTHNAKELFYTLENIQVDCRELSEDQIKEMADVFEKSGYKVGGLGMSKEVRFLLLEDGICFIGNSRDKHTITYSKFMELFDNKLPPYKKASLKWNYDTLVGDVMETTDDVSPISSREKELKKTLKYLLKKDIILTPKQYNKLFAK